MFDTNDAAITALSNGQIDAIVVDLPTAFYVTAAQIDGGVIVGQFPSPTRRERRALQRRPGQGQRADRVRQRRIAAMKADGSLDAITKEWLSDKASAPVFTP